MTMPSALLCDPELRRALVAHVRRRVPAPDVEDVVQATLAEAVRAVPRFDAGEAERLRRWIFGVARHKIADALRARRREVPGELDDLPTAGAAGDPATRDLLDWAERALPPGDEARQTLDLMLREGDGERLEHLATEARVPPATLRQRVSRLRRHLRARWAVEIAVVAVALIAALAVVLARSAARPAPPPIAAEPDADRDRAHALRREAFTRCAEARWTACVDGLDEARALDPAGDAEPAVQRARQEAARALHGPPREAPAPAPLVAPSAPVAPPAPPAPTAQHVPPGPRDSLGPPDVLSTAERDGLSGPPRPARTQGKAGPRGLSK